MRIVYHHRTRSTDAQRIHIQEIVRAFEQLGHEVEVASLVPLDQAQGDAARDAGDAWWKRLARRIPFAYDAAQLGYNLVGAPMLLMSLLTRRADFIYERHALYNFSGLIASKIFRVPLILEVNSPFALEQARDGEIRSRRFAAWTERVTCNHATRVIVVSTPLARLMTQNGVSPAKLAVMPNGVDPAAFEPGSAGPELRERLGLTGSLVIGFIGWFRRWHGLELLLEAFLRSGLARENVKVLLIGDGPAMPDLRSFVEEQGMQNSVVFAGPVPHGAAPPYLDLVDIAAQPAANEYCCPMKILEYMALGKPIVAPAQPNIQELLTTADAEFFAPEDAESLAEALRRVTRDPKRAREMGGRARAAIYSRGYLWSENARRVIEMVRRAATPAATAAGAGFSARN
jgi:glycosyltransferase involved in cell wall biosynthesis